MMPYTKAVITGPYYDKPEWIANEITREEFICLSSESNERDVELFLILLFGYNHINVEQSFLLSFNELLEQEGVVLSGGIAFFEDENKYILPSCCCGLEDFSGVIDTIINRQSPWMGHDPAQVLRTLMIKYTSGPMLRKQLIVMLTSPYNIHIKNL